MKLISASILAANHINLERDIVDVINEGGDRIHVDIMDGHYVKNLTFGPKTVQDLRGITKLPIDVHLEMFNQEDFIGEFISAGADLITLQLESCLHPLIAINQVKSNGCKVSLAIAPTTSIDMIKLFVHELDEVNIMSVEPGFGGQKFRTEVYEKIRIIKEVIDQKELSTIITVDVGVDEFNGKRLSALGVTNFVIGNRLFRDGKLKENMAKIKESISIL
jgi:ribulose-phosphate 3-epimerase